MRRILAIGTLAISAFFLDITRRLYSELYANFMIQYFKIITEQAGMILVEKPTK